MHKSNSSASYINFLIIIKNAAHFHITPTEKIDNTPLIRRLTIEISATSPNSLLQSEHGKKNDINIKENNMKKVKGYIFQLFAPTENIKQAKQATKK